MTSLFVTNLIFLICLSCIIVVSGCSSNLNANKGKKETGPETIREKNTVLRSQSCIMVGKFSDLSGSADFSNLSKEQLGRRSIYGQLAPLRYRDIEISVVDKSLKNNDISESFKALRELGCDYYIKGEIIKFSNKFFLTYSVTEIAMRIELFNERGESVWFGLEKAKSDAGAIPFTPISALTGIFFASKNKKEEIAVRLMESVSRKLIEQLDQFLNKTQSLDQFNSISEKTTAISDTYSIPGLRLAIEINDLDRAENIASHLLQQISDDSELFFLVGKVHMQKGEFQVAKKFFSRAIEIDASQSDYHNGLGITNLQLGDDLEALTNFESAISNNKKNVSARIGLALLSENNGLIEESGKHLYQAGLHAISTRDYAAAVYTLSELKRLALKKNTLLQKAEDLEAVIKFNRNTIR